MTPPRSDRRRCPSCQGTCQPRKYLCRDCWWQIPQDARQALSKRDSKAVGRLHELLRQLGDQVGLDKVRISP